MRYALFAAIALSPLAVAADPIDDAIDARQSYFTLLGANIGPLAAMAKGDIPYDAGAAELHAGHLELLADYTVTPHFPEDSSKADRTGDTRALPEIWDNLADFESKHGDLEDPVAALADVAGDGRAALGQAVSKVGEACKACHDDYRADDF